ncbi:hypothetical protein GCM10008931_07400 [Oceanobacillus oncorhynchi subsp. oncorhynchi]
MYIVKKFLALIPEQSKELAELTQEEMMNFVDFNNVHNPAAVYIRILF